VAAQIPVALCKVKPMVHIEILSCVLQQQMSELFSFMLYFTGYTAVKEGSCNKVDSCRAAAGKPRSNVLTVSFPDYHLINILYCFYI
jgi:hypothetical protein